MGKKKRAVVKRPLTKKQRSRAEREKRITRWLIIGTAVVGVLVIGILAYGLFNEVVLKAREPVAVVNGVPIRTADFQARVRFRRYELINYGLGDQLANYGVVIANDVLEQMVSEELFRQEAERRGITVSEEEIDRAIELQYFGYDRDAATALPDPSAPVTATPTFTPTTREEFEQNYQNMVDTMLKPSKLGVAGFRAMVKASLLGQKIYNQFAEEVPERMEQVEVRYVYFETEEEANQMVERLDAGESWEDVVADLENNETATVVNTPIRWPLAYAEREIGLEVGAAIFAAPVGSYTRPVPSDNGRFYVFYVLDHSESELSEVMRSYEQNRLFEEWLEAQRALVEYSPDWQDKVPTEP